jgi:hypothetical protein
MHTSPAPPSPNNKQLQLHSLPAPNMCDANAAVPLCAHSQHVTGTNSDNKAMLCAPATTASTQHLHLTSALSMCAAAAQLRYSVHSQHLPNDTVPTRPQPPRSTQLMHRLTVPGMCAAAAQLCHSVHTQHVSSNCDDKMMVCAPATGPIILLPLE